MSAQPIPCAEVDTRHIFTISVAISGAKSDWTSDPCTVVEKAYCLADALRQAVDRPLTDWFAEEMALERESDHVEALRLIREGECAFCGRPSQKRRWWHLTAPPWCDEGDEECERLRGLQRSLRE